MGTDFKTKASGGLLALALSGAVAAQPNEAAGAFVPRLPGLQPGADAVWSYGLRSNLLLSDNLTTQGAGSEQRGGLLEISPFVFATVNQARQSGYLAYSLRNFYRSTDREVNTARHDLNAMGSYALSDNWLWLTARALVRDTGLSPFQGAAVDPATSSSNRLRYSSFDLSPHVFGRLAGEVGYQFRYIFNYSDLGGVLPNSTGHTLIGALTKDPLPAGFGWFARANGEAREFDNQTRYETFLYRMGVSYLPSAAIRVGLSADYYRNSVLFDQSGRNSGWGPGGFVTWRPNPRMGAELSASDLYTGTAASARVFYRAQLFTAGLQYSTGVTGTGAAMGSVLDSSQMLTGSTPTPGGSGVGSSPNNVADELALRGLVSSAGQPILSGVIGAPQVKTKTIGANAGLIGVRNSMLLTVFKTDRQALASSISFAPSAATLNSIEQTGASLVFGHRYNTVVSFSSSASVVRSKTDDSNGLSNSLRVFTLGSQYLLQRGVQAGLTYRLSDLASDGTIGNDYRENALIVSFIYQVR